MFYCCHFFSLWAFRRNVGAQSPLCLPSLKGSPDSCRWHRPEATGHSEWRPWHPAFTVESGWHLGAVYAVIGPQDVFSDERKRSAPIIFSYMI